MRQFAGLELTGQIPDESTILGFRHLLDRHNLQEKMHQRLNDVLEIPEFVFKRRYIG